VQFRLLKTAKLTTNCISIKNVKFKYKIIMVKKWTQEETDELVRLVECSWDWHFPGWWQMAHSLNSDFKNNRSISACYQKYSRYIESLRPK